MSEACFDKFLKPSILMNCPEHTWQAAQHICCDSNCKKNAVMCNQCLQEDDLHKKDHQNQIKPINDFVNTATQEIETHARQNKEVLKEIFQQQEDQQLLKWYDDYEIHLKKVEDHIHGQKVMISEDIANLLNNFSEVLNVVKKNQYEKLDEFYQGYRESFKNYRDLLQENFKLSKNYQFYNNPNNLGAKLQSELPKNSNYFVQDLKKAIHNAKNINTNKSSFVSSIKKMSQNINQMMDNLPVYLPAPSYDDILKELQVASDKFIKQNLKIEDCLKLQVTKDIQIETKKSSNYQILNDNKNLLTVSQSEDIQLKPVKKYQLDIPVTAMTALSDIHLALSSCHDNKLRIFESQQKKIHTIQAHSQPITYLTKIITEDKYMINNKENSEKKNSKKVLLVSASQDFSVILWTFDYDMKQNPQVYSKLIGFANIPMTILDLQDSQNIVTGDNFGEICIWDVHKQKIQFKNSSQHHQKITGIALSKKYDKFISASEDNAICIWRLTYSGSKLENFQLESRITEEFSGISCLNLSIKDPNLVFLGTKSGSLKLYDIYNKKMVAETNAHANPVLDLSLLEENISSKDTVNEFTQKMALLSIGVNDKYIRMWKINKKKESKEYEFTGLKLDVSIQNEDLFAKSKVQILKGQAPKFVLANEKNKELLVYEISN